MRERLSIRRFVALSATGTAFLGTAACGGGEEQASVPEIEFTAQHFIMPESNLIEDITIRLLAVEPAEVTAAEISSAAEDYSSMILGAFLRGRAAHTAIISREQQETNPPQNRTDNKHIETPTTSCDIIARETIGKHEQSSQPTNNPHILTELDCFVTK